MIRKKTNEAEVRRMVGEGKIAAEIATALNISADAVRQMAARHNMPLVKATSTFWNDARKAVIRKAVEDKISALACANSIGHGCTRNMCLSMAKRMGLTFAGQMSDRAKTERARKGIRTKLANGQNVAPPPRRAGQNRSKPPKPVKAAGFTFGQPIHHEPLPPRPAFERIEPAGKVTLLELGAHHCKWPVGDPQSETFRFCGDHKEIDASYCTAHAARAYVAPRPRPPHARCGKRRAA